MATASVTYTFTNGSTADADQVDQNFTDVVGFINTNAIQKDGSLAMTAALQLANAEPTNAQHALRRKSGYRSCLNAHMATNTFTVSGGTATVFTDLSTATNMFGFTPDYNYELIVLLTGVVLGTGAGQTISLSIDSPSGTGIGVFGNGASNTLDLIPAAASQPQSVSFMGKKNVNSGVVPTYTIRYKVTGVTAMSAWLTGVCWIAPQTRQLPN